ncbi:ATP-binding protein [Methanolobus profundi]|uniref:4Fe-4S dicluster domain-containing protein n=1 Tax=Methanolobus profundi TaxID=487685 RepID=A0A1I4RSU7_9EURY|nr:4Fe-4S binding protein [Methanolobus profundi]SFM55352.1 4Fe-4S dicluster domain-containing protein [Methanolobus profundi]
MSAIIDKSTCTGCEQCVDTCPVDAITMAEGDVALVDADACVDCGDCVDICPVEAITMK